MNRRRQPLTAGPTPLRRTLADLCVLAHNAVPYILFPISVLLLRVSLARVSIHSVLAVLRLVIRDLRRLALAHIIMLWLSVDVAFVHPVVVVVLAVLVLLVLLLVLALVLLLLLLLVLKMFLFLWISLLVAALLLASSCCCRHCSASFLHVC